MRNYNESYITVLEGKDEWDDDEYDQYLTYLQDIYSFHITNPSFDEGVGVGLWIDDVVEYPIIHWSDLQYYVHFSANPNFGTKPIQPTEDFFKLIAFGTKEAEWVGIEEFEEEKLDHVIGHMMSNGYGWRFHEVMVAKTIIRWLASDDVHPELDPIATFVDRCSVKDISRMVIDDA